MLRFGGGGCITSGLPKKLVNGQCPVKNGFCLVIYTGEENIKSFKF